MHTKEMIEKQFFIVNLENVDIADVLYEADYLDNHSDVEFDDSEYLQKLLAQEELDFKTLENSKAIVKYKDTILSICFKNSDKEYKLSLMEFLGYPIYKKLTSYFLGQTDVTIKNVSEQIGEIIDTNYGFKFMVEIG